MKQRRWSNIRILAGMMIILLLITVAWVDPFGYFTVTATKFNAEKFQHVMKGMLRDDVRNLLGDPLKVTKMEWNERCPLEWIYSRKGHGTLFYCDYRVYFDASGRVLSANSNMNY